VHCITLLLVIAASQPRVSFCAVGDILLDRGIRKKIPEQRTAYASRIGVYTRLVHGFSYYKTPAAEIDPQQRSALDILYTEDAW
jgi:hypothetical protein